MNEESRRSKIVTAGREEQCRMSSRRRMLLAGTALAGLSTVGLRYAGRAGPGRQNSAAGRGRQEAEHPGHLRRRHRPVEHQRLHDGPDGLPDAQYRPDRQGRHDLHRLLRRAELHGGPVDLHHRPVHASHRPQQGRRAGRHGRACRRRTRPSPSCSSRSATPPASSARTTSATATSTCRRHGFDEFFGNLYHLNAEEEPEQRNLPARSRVPQEVLRPARRRSQSPAADGKQTIEDTGPLTKKRMETIDDETSAAAIDFIERQAKAEQAVLLLVQHARACTSAPMSRRSTAARRA